MLGGLHIEQAALKAIGTWLACSGWVEVLSQAEITTAGRAESLVNCAHITRTRYAHQVTAASLFILQKGAYRKYVESVKEGEEADSFSTWRSKKETTIPQFKYWNITLQFELLLLTLMRSFRESSFTLYTEALVGVAAWMFALDRTNYARWLPVHVRDMLALQSKHPEIYREFQSGKFTVQKTANAFPAIPLDQVHEQNNELIKGDGGALGLTMKPSALLRWMVSGPELARLVKEFENSDEDQHTQLLHHEQSHASQTRFKNHVSTLVSTIEELGNPFEETSEDLVSLMSKDILMSSVVQCVPRCARLTL